MMKKRGKRLSVSLEAQRAAFLVYKDMFKDIEDLPMSTSRVYDDLSKLLKSRISPGALYVSLKRNYKTFFNNVDFTQAETPPDFTFLDIDPVDTNYDETTKSYPDFSDVCLQTTELKKTSKQQPPKLKSKVKHKPDINDALRRTELSLANTALKKPKLNVFHSCSEAQSTATFNKLPAQQEVRIAPVIVEPTKPPEDEFYYFAMSVAAQLRALPLNMALKMQVKIQDQLYLARKQSINGNGINKFNNNRYAPPSPDIIEIENNPLEFEELATFKEETENEDVEQREEEMVNE